MKRNGRHRNGSHAKHRRARIARRLKRADERRVTGLLVAAEMKFEAEVFGRMYKATRIGRQELLAEIGATPGEAGEGKR